MPAVDRAGVLGLLAAVVQLVVFDEVAAEPVVAEVDAVIGCVFDMVVADQVALAPSCEDARAILVEDPGMVDVVVGHFVEQTGFFLTSQ